RFDRPAPRRVGRCCSVAWYTRRGKGRRVTEDARQHVVVTGLGAVTPVGVGVAAYTRSLRAGVDGVRAVAFDDPRVRTSAAAECVGFDPSRVVSEADARRLPRLVPMALRAAREACAMAGLPEFTGEDRVDAARRVGLVL